jgi:hypothetical protein
VDPESLSNVETLTPDEQEALASLSPIERRLFGDSIRYWSDKGVRTNLPIGQTTLKSGFSAVFQTQVGRQEGLMVTAIGWLAVALEAIFVVGKLSGAGPVLLVVAIFALAGVGFVVGLVRLHSARRTAREFIERGSPRPVLHPAAAVPIPAPKSWAWPPFLFSADAIATGIALTLAPHTAPQVTGVFFIALGLGLLGLTIHMVRKGAL